MSNPTVVRPTGAVILSFDVEEHYRIEAAAHLQMDSAYEQHCRERVDHTTRWLLDRLAELQLRATFFLVGQIARDNPKLVRAIGQQGHEVASHGWAHTRVHRLTRESFREDLRKSKDALEQITGQAVIGYRAPTFSIMRETAWAVDVLVEEGICYDSSIYPVRHDRYGVPDAPRTPFHARGAEQTILELPPATLRIAGINTPMGGGGYFRLFPLSFTRYAIRQLLHHTNPPVAMLYFHPWEFDVEQRKLPLGRMSQLRTYVGIPRTRERLARLLAEHRCVCAADVVEQLRKQAEPLPTFELTRKGKVESVKYPKLARVNQS